MPVICIKTTELKKFGHYNIKEWLTNDDNIYVGSSFNIYIMNSGKELYNVKSNKWENPYENHENSMIKYVKHLFLSGLIYDIHELIGKNLGCRDEIHKDSFDRPLCHAQILDYLSGKCYHLIKNIQKLDEKYIDKKLIHIEVIPVVFTGLNKFGDFNFMIKDQQYKDVLFIFNDNEESFINKSCIAGSGNAIIRPYQCHEIPSSIGIPTGSLSKGGYKSLTKSKSMIDLSFERIRNLLKTGNYKRVFYSADKNGKLGTSIFDVSDEVKEYIYDNLLSLPNNLYMD